MADLESTEGLDAKELRVWKAIHCEDVDRTPLCCTEPPLLAHLVDDTFVNGDMYTRPEWAMDQIVAGAKKLDSDFMPLYDYAAGNNFFMHDGTTYMMPGRDIPAESCIQVIEHNYMDKAEYYDYVIEHGWKDFYDNYVGCHKDWEQAEKDFNRQMELGEMFAQKLQAAGVTGSDLYSHMLAIDGGVYTLSMMRGFTVFLRDLRKYPEKVKKVVDIIDDEQMAEDLELNEQMGGIYNSFFGSLARIDNGSLSHKMFAEFVWPPLLRLRDKAEENNLYLILHADGDFGNDADLFAQLTPRHTIMQHDGFTDVEALADTYVKNKICFWGDIPCQMMTLGAPEEVYEHAMKLKRLFGPGLILSAGCSYPPNSKVENLLALKEAADNMNF